MRTHLNQTYSLNLNSTTAPSYSAAEELANALSHGLGLLISVAALIYMITILPADYSVLQKTGTVVYGISLILMFLTIISLIILISFNTILSSILGFGILGLGTSSIVPMAYSLVSKIKGVDSGVGITIISIAVYGTFIGAPSILGLLANSYGINYIFTPILVIFILLIIPIKIFKNEFKL